MHASLEGIRQAFFDANNSTREDKSTREDQASERNGECEEAESREDRGGSDAAQTVTGQIETGQIETGSLSGSAREDGSARGDKLRENGGVRTAGGGGEGGVAWGLNPKPPTLNSILQTLNPEP